MLDSVVRNVRLTNDLNQLVDIGIINGEIHAIGSISEKGREEVNAFGGMALPPFVEPHIHLDTVLTAGEPAWNQSGTLFEGIQVWSARKQQMTDQDVKERALSVLRTQLEHGILHVRSHVDISDPDLTALQSLLEVKEAVSQVMNLQIVAFPQDGILACPGNVKRLEQSLRMGADAIGAIPHYEQTQEDGVQSLEICFALAEKYNKMVNVFCDETDDPDSKFLEVVASFALRTGLKEKVAASHANAMSYYSEPYFRKLLSLLQESKINMISCPLVSTVMQGRLDPWPKGRGITRIRDLYEAGVNVCIGHDDIMTPFYPLGTGNMLQAAHMAVHVGHMSGVDEMKEIIHMITDRGAKALQIESAAYGVEVGKPASFVVLPAKEISELIRYMPKPRYVFSNGHRVAETVPTFTNVYMEEIFQL